MNTYLFASVDNVWLLAGWTMIHFLWLGTIVALAALLSRWLLRRTPASVRYVTAIACLATLASLPVAVATWLCQNPVSYQVEGSLQRARNVGGFVASAASARESSPISEPIIDLAKQQPNPTNAMPPQPVQPAARADNLPVIAPTASSAPLTDRDLLSFAVVAINTSVHYLPWLWLIGTPITFAVTATGLIGTRRLRRASRPITGGPITEALEKLAASLRLTRHVVVAVCDRIAAPVLIGILRPVILLPPAALTGYSPDEIEMVLLHELAHVRRWDNLVNLLQRLIESLLFFHPAVWLISSWVRREREACCDALVVTRTDRPHAYAELLIALAAQMPRSVLFHPAASSAMAAGPLRSRIRRILQLDDDPMLISGKSFAAVLAALLLAATLAILYLPTIGQAEQSATEAAESTKKAVSPRIEAAKANHPESSDQAAFSHFEAGIKKPIPLIIAIFNDSSGYAGQLEDTYDKLLRQGQSVYVWGFNLDPSSDAAKRYRIKDGPTIIIFRDGKETSRLENIQSPKQLREFIDHALPTANDKFPSLENQKLADLAYKRLLLEIEPISKEDLKRVKAFGYEGGVKVTSVSNPSDRAFQYNEVQPDDILVGLHVWPTTSLQDIASVLKRDDLQELNPLKFYVVRSGRSQNSGFGSSEPKEDTVISGRISLKESRASAPPINPSTLPTPTGSSNAPSTFLDAPYNVAPRAEANPYKAPSARSSREPTPAPVPYIPRVTLDTQADPWRPTPAPTSPAAPRGNTVPAAPSPPTSSQPFVDPQPSEPTLDSQLQIAKDRDPRASISNKKRDEQRAAVKQLVKAAADQLAKAAKTKDEALTKRQQAKEHDAVEAAKHELETADRQFEDAKRTLEISKRQLDELERQNAARNRGEQGSSTTKPRPVVAVEQPTDAATQPASSEELTILREQVKIADDQFKYNVGMYKKGAKGGSQDKVEIAAYELALAEADLATAEGKHDEIIAKMKDAQAHAEEAYKAVAAAYEAGRVSYDLLRKESKNLSEIKLKVARLQQGTASAPNQQTNSQYAYIKIVPGTADAPAAKPNLLRYDGKSFDDWCYLWQTDLSTEKRTEAVKAIAAFGANGYGPEAAATLVELAGQYDWKTIGDNLATVPLQIACVNAFGGAMPSANNIGSVAQSIPVKDALAELSLDAKSGNLNQKLFLTYVLPVISHPQSVELRLVLSKDDDPLVRKYALASLPRLSEMPDNDRVAARIREALSSKDSEEVLAALGRLMPQGDLRVNHAYLPPEFTGTLFSPDERIRKNARKVAQYANGEDAARIVNEMLVVLKDESRKKQHVEAIRALAALGQHAKSAVEKLHSLVKSENQPHSIAAVNALRRILDTAEYNKMLVESFGDRLGITLQNGGEGLGLPSDRQKFRQYQTFERPLADEQKQLFP